mmetsp:Transcript_47096/g.112952  ORF Transcript_47096/g.112952 Transcript_47096/m.112952 type:complete len:235 (+) Transcript_47096:1454-2158(+)
MVSGRRLQVRKDRRLCAAHVHGVLKFVASSRAMPLRRLPGVKAQKSVVIVRVVVGVGCLGHNDGQLESSRLAGAPHSREQGRARATGASANHALRVDSEGPGLAGIELAGYWHRPVNGAARHRDGDWAVHRIYRELDREVANAQTGHRERGRAASFNGMRLGGGTGREVGAVEGLTGGRDDDGVRRCRVALDLDVDVGGVTRAAARRHVGHAVDSDGVRLASRVGALLARGEGD